MSTSSNHAGLTAKAGVFWPVLLTVLTVDYFTKRWAELHLSPVYVPHQVLGNFMRLTLTYNKDAAMGLSLGGYSRIGFVLSAAVVLGVLGAMYRRAAPGASGRAAAIALIAAGALGNLSDRLISSRGVVDFIDIGVGGARFWTFNVADAAITCGAVLLAILSMRTGGKTVRARAAAS
jgi:signal peptidase II